MNKGNIIDSFTIGGTSAGASMPGVYLQRMLGTRIFINMEAHTLTVPTPYGRIIASKGDTIVLYDDDTLDVFGGDVT